MVQKIKVANPVVDLDGDEMTRYEPFSKVLKLEYRVGCLDPKFCRLQSTSAVYRVIWQMIKDKVCMARSAATSSAACCIDAQVTC